MKLIHDRLRPGDFRVIERGHRPEGALRILGLQADAGLRVGPGQLVLIIAWKGSLNVHCAEGSFRLAARQWMLCHKESCPMVLSGSGMGTVAVADEHLRGTLGLQHFAGFSMCGVLNLRGIRSCRLVAQATHGQQEATASILPAQAIDSLIQAQSGVRPWLDQCPGRTMARRYQVLGRMMRAKMYLDGHPDRVVRVTELSRLASFSPWHFTKTFRQLFGISPQAYGVRVRLQRARELVCAGELSIRDISVACGFDNSCSFARAFHEYFGCSASAMRAEGRNGSGAALVRKPIRARG